MQTCSNVLIDTKPPQPRYIFPQQENQGQIDRFKLL